MAGGFVGVDLFLASGRLLGSCALSVRCGPGNTGQDTIGFEIEIENRLQRMGQSLDSYALPLPIDPTTEVTCEEHAHLEFRPGVKQERDSSVTEASCRISPDFGTIFPTWGRD